MGIDSQVCFHRGLFSSLSNRERPPPQQAEILDTDAEIRAEILLEIRGPKSQATFFPIISVKYVNLYHVNYNV